METIIFNYQQMSVITDNYYNLDDNNPEIWVLPLP